MFSPPLDKPRVVRGIQDVLCSKRVINYRDKASKVMTEVKSGRVSAETMEWVIRGLRSFFPLRDLSPLITHSIVSAETGPLFTSIITLEALSL